MEGFNIIFYSNDSVGENDFEEYDVKHIHAIQTYRECNIISAYFGRMDQHHLIFYIINNNLSNKHNTLIIYFLVCSYFVNFLLCLCFADI